MVVDVGAWLSFGATLGIIIGATQILAGPADSAAARHHYSLRPRSAGLRSPCSAPIAAELMLLPIAASVFTRVGVAGLILNFIAIPAMAAVQIAGAAAIALASLSTAAASARDSRRIWRHRRSPDRRVSSTSRRGSAGACRHRRRCGRCCSTRHARWQCGDRATPGVGG